MLIATVRLPAAALALEQTLRERPEIRIEAERIAAHSTEWTMPCLWVASDDDEAAETAIRRDPSVASIIDIEVFESESYHHLEWSEAVQARIDAYTDKEGSILSATTADGGWVVKFRFASRDQFDSFRETITEAGHDFELLDLYEPDTPHARREGLTPAQRRALLAARDRGYYEVPRGITTRELAAELGISHQSLSELLRRGTERLIDHTLTTGDDRR